METTELTYTGPPRLVGALAQMLKEAGLSVSYQPPMETKDLAGAATVVSLALAVTGPVPDIVSAVREFRGRFPGAQVDGVPEVAKTVRERLEELSELHDEGVITEGEWAAQRARILGEI